MLQRQDRFDESSAQEDLRQQPQVSFPGLDMSQSKSEACALCSAIVPLPQEQALRSNQIKLATQCTSFPVEQNLMNTNLGATREESLSYNSKNEAIEPDTPMFAATNHMLKTSLGKRSYALKRSSEERDPNNQNTDDSSCVKMTDCSCAKMPSESSSGKTLNNMQTYSSNMVIAKQNDFVSDTLSDVCQHKHLTPTDHPTKKRRRDSQLWLSPDVSPNKRPKYDSKYSEIEWDSIRGHQRHPKSESVALFTPVQNCQSQLHSLFQVTKLNQDQPQSEEQAADQARLSHAVSTPGPGSMQRFQKPLPTTTDSQQFLFENACSHGKASAREQEESNKKLEQKLGSGVVEELDWLDVEQRIHDFLDDEGVHVMATSDAKISFLGPRQSHFQKTPTFRETRTMTSGEPAMSIKGKQNSKQPIKNSKQNTPQIKAHLRPAPLQLQHSQSVPHPQLFNSKPLQSAASHGSSDSFFSLNIANSSLFRARRKTSLTKFLADPAGCR